MTTAVRCGCHVEIDVPCGDSVHSLRVGRSQELTPLHHEVRADRIIRALGGTPSTCVEWIEAVERSTWQMGALAELLESDYTAEQIASMMVQGVMQIPTPERRIVDPHRVPIVLARLSWLVPASPLAPAHMVRRLAFPFVRRVFQGRLRLEIGAPRVARVGSVTTVTLPVEWLSTVWLFGLHSDPALLAYEATPVSETAMLVRAFDSDGRTHEREVPVPDGVRLLL